MVNLAAEESTREINRQNVVPARTTLRRNNARIVLLIVALLVVPARKSPEG
jgi:hypothetical protein